MASGGGGGIQTSSLEHYSNDVRALEQEIQTLKLEKEKLKSKNSKLVNQVNEFQDSIHHFFEVKNYQYTQADQNILQLLFDQIDSLEVQNKNLKQEQAEFKRYREKYTLSADSQSEIMKKYEIVLNNNSNMQAEMEELKNQNSVLNSQSTNLANVNEKLLSANEDISSKNDRITSRMDTLEEENSKIRAKLDFLKSFLDWQEAGNEPPNEPKYQIKSKLEAVNVKLNLDLRDLNAQLQHKVHLIHEQKQRIINLKKQIRTLFNDLSAHHGESPNLNGSQFNNDRKKIGSDLEFSNDFSFLENSMHKSSAFKDEKMENEEEEVLNYNENLVKSLQQRVNSLLVTLSQTQRENYSLLNLNTQLKAIMKKPQTIIHGYDPFSSDEDQLNEGEDSFNDGDNLNLDEVLEDLRAENEKLYFENLKLDQKIEDLREEYEHYKSQHDLESRMFDLYSKQKLVELYEQDSERNLEARKKALKVEFVGEFTVEKGSQMDQPPQEKDLKAQISLLQAEIDQLKQDLKAEISVNEELQSEIELNNDQQKGLLDVIEHLTQQKQYLVQLFIRLEQEIKLCGKDVYNFSNTELSKIVAEIAEARKVNKDQGKLYDVIRTRTEYTNAYGSIGRSELQRAMISITARSEAGHQHSKLGHHSQMNDGEITEQQSLCEEAMGPLSEIQNLNGKIFNLEAKFEEMIEREEEIRHCLITCLVKGKLNSELEARKKELLEKIGKLPEEHEQIQEIQPVLDSIQFLSELSVSPLDASVIDERESMHMSEVSNMSNLDSKKYIKDLEKVVQQLVTNQKNEFESMKTLMAELTASQNDDERVAHGLSKEFVQFAQEL